MKDKMEEAEAECCMLNSPSQGLMHPDLSAPAIAEAGELW